MELSSTGVSQGVAVHQQPHGADRAVELGILQMFNSVWLCEDCGHGCDVNQQPDAGEGGGQAGHRAGLLKCGEVWEEYGQ